jgi:hypothetical protein
MIFFALKIFGLIHFAFAQTNFIVNNSTVGVCICVTAGSCALANPPANPTPTSAPGTDGSGIFDIRIVNVSVFDMGQKQIFMIK